MKNKSKLKLNNIKEKSNNRNCTKTRTLKTKEKYNS